jgi:hypothetical protein
MSSISVAKSISSNLGIPAGNIYAVMSVESSDDDGFFNTKLNEKRVPIILFEAHIFDRLTSGKFRTKYPNISSKRWDRKLYLGGIQEYTRLDLASSLDRKAALASCSWGMFQIMGFNWKSSGAKSLEDFVQRMYSSTEEQVLLFINFIKSSGLLGFLKNGQWDSFAAGYNGPEYAKNHYAEKLAKFMQKGKELLEQEHVYVEEIKS